MGKISGRTIAINFQKVNAELRDAAIAVGRRPEDIQLVVVTKAHPVEVVQEAIEAGAYLFGENYAEEGVQKIEALRRHPGLKWHMIGHVQRRKASLVARYYDFLHSLDSVRLARRVNRFLEAEGRRLPVLLEYNVTAEESKFGWPAWDEADWPNVLPDVEEILTLDHLDIRGVMTIGPFLPDPESVRPYYRKIRLLRDYLASHFPHASWDELSMGMSGDFQVAIEEGATMVRVGQAILGPRPPKRPKSK